MEDKKEMLLSYIKANVAPVLVDFISGKDLNGAVVLPANIDVQELNGHYNIIRLLNVIKAENNKAIYIHLLIIATS